MDVALPKTLELIAIRLRKVHVIETCLRPVRLKGFLQRETNRISKGCNAGTADFETDDWENSQDHGPFKGVFHNKPPWIRLPFVRVLSLAGCTTLLSSCLF